MVRLEVMDHFDPWNDYNRPVAYRRLLGWHAESAVTATNVRLHIAAWRPFRHWAQMAVWTKCQQAKENVPF